MLSTVVVLGDEEVVTSLALEKCSQKSVRKAHDEVQIAFVNARCGHMEAGANQGRLERRTTETHSRKPSKMLRVGDC